MILKLLHIKYHISNITKHMDKININTVSKNQDFLVKRAIAVVEK